MTCRVFHTIVSDILDHTISKHGRTIYDFLQLSFETALDSAKADPSLAPQFRDLLSPLRALPWTSDPKVRAKYERAEASWRKLPLVTSKGSIVHRMHYVSMDQPSRDRICSLFGQIVEFHEHYDAPDLQFDIPRGWTVRMFYEFLIRLDQIVNSPLEQGWTLSLGTRVKTPEQFNDIGTTLRRANTRMTNSELHKLSCADENNVLLLLHGCPDNSREDVIWDLNEQRDDFWYPAKIDAYFHTERHTF